MLSRNTNRCAEQGFTLLEVLVSISVFSMVALVSYSTLDTYIEHRERLQGHYGKLERLQRLFILLERDIQFTIPRKVRVGGDVEAAMVSENGDAMLSMTVAQADFRGASGIALKRVQWRLDGRELIRAQWDVLDHGGQIEADELLVSNEVEAINLNYLIYETNRGVESKDQLIEDELPDAIEVIIELSSGESYRRVFGTALGGN